MYGEFPGKILHRNVQPGSEIIRTVNTLTYLLIVHASWATIKIQNRASKQLLFFLLIYKLVKVKRNAKKTTGEHFFDLLLVFSVFSKKLKILISD